MFLTEGGNAANSLFDRLQQNNPKRKLERVSIPKDQLRLVWRDAIEPILEILGKEGVLDDSYKSKFNLGSTKLAYQYMSGTDNKEVNDAVNKKKSFGDIDLDVSLKDGVTAIDAANIIVKSNPSKYIAKNNGTEANMAVVINGMQMPNGDYIPGAVIQIDLVNVKGKEDSLQFLQSSSEDDMLSGIKGVFHKFLLRALIRHVSAPNIQPETQEAKAEIAKWKSQGYNIDGDTRLSLKDGGLSVVVDMKKFGTKEVKSIPLQKSSIADFSDAGLDKTAKIIFGKSFKASDIRSTKSLCNAIINSDSTKNRIKYIWKEFVKMTENFKYKIEKSDYEAGMKEVAKLLNQKYPLEENSMDNIRESVRKNLYEDDKSIIEEILQSMSEESPETVCDEPGQTADSCEVTQSSVELTEEERNRLKEAYMAGFMSSNPDFNGKNARRVYRNSALKPESVVWNKNHQRGFEHFVRKLG